MGHICVGKVMHETRDIAEFFAERLMRFERRSGSGKKARRIRVYECPRCAAWHVGHKATGRPAPSALERKQQDRERSDGS